MQPKGYLYWILNADKKPLFVGSNGLVQEGDPVTFLKPDGQPAHLETSPDGWKDTLVRYGTNTTYMGLFRDFTVPLRFAKDGAKILRHLRWTYGKEVIAYLAISRLDRASYPHNYEAWYVGELDFSEYKQTFIGVDMRVMEGGLSKLLKAYENTVYEIPVNTDPDKKIVRFDGMPFTNHIDYTVYSGQEVLGTPDGNFYFLGMGITNKTGISQGIVMQDQIFESTSAFPNEKYFQWSTTKTITVKIKGTVHGECTGGSSAFLHLDVIRASDNSNTVYQVLNLGTGSFNNGQFYYYSFNTTITVNPKERLYVRIGAIGGASKFMIYGADISIEYDVTFDETYNEGLRGITMFERLTEKMTNGKYGVKSDWLTAQEDLIFTSGSALRKDYKSSIKTSYADYFQALKTRAHEKKLSIGCAIENDKLVIEELDYFFRNDVIMDLGVVDDLEIVYAKDIDFNTVKVGYKDQTIDDINGRNEVNVTQLYSTPNTRIQRELDLVSAYRADPYGIESARSDKFGQQDTSSTADNDIFMVSVDKQGLVNVPYYSGPFQTEVSGGAYYIKIPNVVSQIQNGQTVNLTGSVSNNGTYTVLNTSYIVVGFTVITVQEPVTNESIDGDLFTQSINVYYLKRLAYSPITGVDHPAELFNIELSPKRCLLNCGGAIHPAFDKMDTLDIVLASAPRNIELSTTFAGVTVKEKATVPVGSLTPSLYRHDYFNFTAAPPSDFPIIMKTNPYGRIKFTDGKTGAVLYGRMWDGGMTPEPNQKQTWKLIASPNNDMTKLI